MNTVGVLILLIIANGAPLLLMLFLPPRLHLPLDGGKNYSDGQPLLGPSKTWPGLLIAIAGSTMAALMLDVPALLGALVGLLAMLGDLSSSFIKRRKGLACSQPALGLDQIPESLLPGIALTLWFQLSALQLASAVVSFMIFNLAITHLLSRMGIHNKHD